MRNGSSTKNKLKYVFIEERHFLVQTFAHVKEMILRNVLKYCPLQHV